MSDLCLVAKELHKTYRSGQKKVGAVNGISLEVKKGEALAIVGPSGAGKSTFLHMLGGLDNPTSGKVMMNGIDLYSLSDAKRAKVRNRNVGFVFQFYHLLPEFTALENVMMPSLISGGKHGRRKELKAKAVDILGSVGLHDRMDHIPAKLSGGESQRVAIARALINDPDLLLCDEPTGNLDSKTSESIYELLLGLQSKTGMTVVVVTHDERISSRIKKVVRIRDGRIA